MSKILVTGASGFVGSKMCKLLLNQAFDVKGISRHTIHKGKIIGDFHNIHDWTDIINDCKIILHFSAIVHKKDKKFLSHSNKCNDKDYKSTIQLVKDADKLGVEKFIFLSSIGVNGKFNSRKINTKTEYNSYSKYTDSKKNIEMKLLEISKKVEMEVIIIRSPLIYGRDAPGTFKILHKAITSNLPLPFGSLKTNKRSYISINNLLDFILFVILRTENSTGIFLVSDNNDVSTSELVNLMKIKSKSKSIIINFPPVLLKLIFSIIGKKNWIYSTMMPLQIDCQETTNKLGWQPPYVLEDEINKIFD